ncbi:hypothetical protein [Paludibaculum fermentans]|uniref:hypothetical protein n=1 Tax=Paludibaculum fermentans TaxID=1473598 RepID=UPI003EBA5465
MNSEPADRYLCSSLVSIHLPATGRRERKLDANLEEISASRAYLNVEEPLQPPLALRIICTDNKGKHRFDGVVTGSFSDPAAGCYIEVEFNPGTTWSPELFKPNHMVRASTILGMPSAEPPPRTVGCDRGVCPKEVLSGLFDPQAPLTGRVRAVAKQVASLCGAMTDKETVGCFETLFGAGAECRLFTEFQESYAQGRKLQARPHHRTLRTRFNGLMQLANAIPREVVRSKCGPDRTSNLIHLHLPER